MAFQSEMIIFIHLNCYNILMMSMSDLGASHHTLGWCCYSKCVVDGAHIYTPIHFYFLIEILICL